MTERCVRTCRCERCGNCCHHLKIYCDPCQEVRRLREALGLILTREVREYRSDSYVADRARKALEETPW